MEHEGIEQEQKAVPGAPTRGQLGKVGGLRVFLVAVQGAERVRVLVAQVGVGVVSHIVPAAPEFRGDQGWTKADPAEKILHATAHAQRAV